MSTHFFKVIFLEMLEYFQFLAKTRGHHGLLKSPSGNIGSMQKIWNQKKTVLAQICISTVTLVPSLFWHFLHQLFSISFYLFSLKNNLKIISTWLPEKWRTLVFCSENTSLALICPRIQCRDYIKRNTESDATAGRGCKTYTCTTEDLLLDRF